MSSLAPNLESVFAKLDEAVAKAKLKLQREFTDNPKFYGSLSIEVSLQQGQPGTTRTRIEDISK